MARMYDCKNYEMSSVIWGLIRITEDESPTQLVSALLPVEPWLFSLVFKEFHPPLICP